MGGEASALDKSRLFIQIPWTKSGFLSLLTYTLTGLFAKNVFAFYGLSYSDTSRVLEAALGPEKDLQRMQMHQVCVCVCVCVFVCVCVCAYACVLVFAH
jgi:hypothetical protein